MSGKAEPSVLREALGARLRAEREAHGWTFRKLAEKLSDASAGICDVPDVESIIPQIRRWERGAAGIGEHYRTLYCVVFEMGMELFGCS
jgi:transcriptional regulator with XRE-family HTH domain